MGLFNGNYRALVKHFLVVFAVWGASLGTTSKALGQKFEVDQGGAVTIQSPVQSAVATDGCFSNADCSAGTFCSDSGACVACLVDEHCSDGVFCNGLEVCIAGACRLGGTPCPDQPCNESTDTCESCFDDVDCDDGVFCNGLEVCNAAGGCVNGDLPCAEDEECDEAGLECVPVDVQSWAYCATLGDQSPRLRRDVDAFQFSGNQGENVLFLLSPTDESATGRAELVLQDLVRGTFFRVREFGPLPLALSATLPASGWYRISVVGHHARRGDRFFNGDYCLSLESSARAYETVVVTPSVEDRSGRDEMVIAD